MRLFYSPELCVLYREELRTIEHCQRKNLQAPIFGLWSEMARLSGSSASRDVAFRPSDHVLGFEILQVARGEAQPLGIDLGIMLAKQRRAIDFDV